MSEIAVRMAHAVDAEVSPGFVVKTATAGRRAVASG